MSAHQTFNRDFNMENNTEGRPLDFVREIVSKDVSAGKNGGRVHTRFPPEPNGYLHIGHAKAICIDFGIAREFGGKCNLRMDDTNPSKEDVEYVESIQEDVRWIGFDWEDRFFYASDYFEQMYEYAVKLIKKGKAYVCDLGQDHVKDYRGTLTQPGKESPFRNRSVEENLDLFSRMRAGEFPDGSRTLRAKIDMAHPNILLRDPVMYRILHETHHRTGDKWCIYPTYDWAHGLEDSIEGITHSICTLEFEIHRPLYDWFLDELEVTCHPQQIEFARLNISYTVMSKRKLLELVQDGHVNGWDDPRLPTIAGMRRRGYPPEAIRKFCETVGVTKYNSLTDIALLEHCVRDELNRTARRMMAVFNPIKVVIENYPDGKTDEIDAVNNPEDPAAGTRKVPFSKTVWIEQDDFKEDPPKKFYRLAPGREVRLRYAYIIKCEKVIKDEKTGLPVELICSYDPATRGGNAPDGRKIQGTIHWVSAEHTVKIEARLYDRLFTKENPDDAPEGQDFKSNLNPDSLRISAAFAEPAAAALKPGERIQFERVGYFCADKDSKPGNPVFNRIATLKDSWSKIEKKSG